MKHSGFLATAICVLCACGVHATPPNHDVAITIDNGAEYSVDGSTVTYTATVSNSGPDTALLSGIGISPDGYMFSDVTYTAVANGTASGFSASGVGYVDDFDVSISPGSSVVYTLIATFANDAHTYGPLATIVAYVTLYDEGTDPNHANNSTDDSDFIFGAPITVWGVPAHDAIFEGTALQDLPVALISDPLTAERASDYAVAINWGDGSTSGGFLDPLVVNEKQTVTIGGFLGAFTLTFNGQTTNPLAYNASATQVQNALNALSTIGAGNNSVSQSGSHYTVEFTGVLGLQNVQELTGAGIGGATVDVVTSVEGGASQLTVYGDHRFIKDSTAAGFDISVAIAHGNLIRNPSFELPVGVGQYASIPGWTLADFAAGLSIEIADTNIGAAKDGAQFVELNSVGATAIYQTVPTLPGQAYILNFLFAPRQGTNSGHNNIEISVNDSAIGGVSLDGTADTTLQWQRFSFEYTAVSASSKIQFKSLSPAGDQVGGLLDAIQFAPMLTDFAVTSAQVVGEAQIENLTGISGQALSPLGGVTSFDAAAATFTNPNEFDDVSGHTAVIDWGDGTTSPGTVIKDSAHNYHVNAPDYTYTARGTYQVKVTVTHAPEPPLTVDSIVAIIFGPPTADAQTVTAAFNTPLPITLTGTDPNAPPLEINFSVTAQPTHGILTGNAPNVTYTPDFGFFGQDSFQFTVKNTPWNLSATAMITIDVAANTAPPVVGIGNDSDGDGFSDDFEYYSATDPSDFSSTPTGSVITANTLQPLTVSKAAIKLNFAVIGKDSIAFSGTINIPDNFSPDGKRVLLDAGSVGKSFMLTAKGSVATANESVKLAIKAKKGMVSAQAAKYAVTFKNGNFRSELANSGLTNADAKNLSVAVKFTFILNNVVCQAAKPMLYTAKAEKSGAAK